MTRNSLAFLNVDMPIAPTAEAVQALLERLAQRDGPTPLVFELRAKEGRVWHQVATTFTQMHALRRTITIAIPGSRVLEPEEDRRPHEAVRLFAFAGPVLGLAVERGENLLRAVYGICVDLQDGEELGIQVVVKRTLAPTALSHRVPDPHQSLIRVALEGVQPASSSTRRELANFSAAIRFDITLRLGVSAEPQRARHVGESLTGSLSLLTSPGTRPRLRRDSPERFMIASPGPTTRVTAAELVYLLAWPLADLELAGRPLHPRRFPPPKAGHAKTDIAIGSATASGLSEASFVRLSLESRGHHVALTGPTGSGKSTVAQALVIADVLAKRPGILLDPKRQLVDSILDALPEDVAGRVVVLDPNDEPTVGFNPLDTRGRPGDVVVDGVLDALKSIFDDGWGPRTEDLLLAGLRSLALAGERRGRPFTLIELPSIYTDASLRREVAGLVADEPVLAGFWATFNEMTPSAQAAMIAAPLNKLRRFLLRPGLVRLLGQSQPRLSLLDLFSTDRTVLVPLNDALLGPGAADLAGQLIVATVWQAVQARAAEEDPRARPGSVTIDEAARFVHLPALDDALATSRGYGVAWTFAYQFRDQLGARFNAALDANARSKIVFNTSPDDARAFARMALSLEPDDFTTLDQYEAQASFYANGRSNEWFTMKTLPPEHRGHGDTIREASRRNFGALPDVPSNPTLSTTPAPKRPSSNRKKRADR